MYFKRILVGYDMKYKSVSISNYFELVKPQYVFFKLTPHNSCRNNSSYKLVQLVNKLYIDFTKRVYIEEKKLFLGPIQKFHITSI